MNTILVTFLLDLGVEVTEWKVQIVAATTDVEFMLMLQRVTYGLLNQNATILRIEANDRGEQIWMTVADVMSL